MLFKFFSCIYNASGFDFTKRYFLSDLTFSLLSVHSFMEAALIKHPQEPSKNCFSVGKCGNEHDRKWSAPRKRMVYHGETEVKAQTNT